MVRSTEVDGDAGLLFDLSIAMKLGAVIDRDRLEVVRPGADELEKALVQRCDGAVEKLADECFPSDAFDECEDAILGDAANDGIHLPVTELLSRFDRCGPLGDVPLAADTSSLLVSAVAFATLDRLAKAQVQIAAPAAVHPDMLVDRLVADAEDALQA